MNTENISVFTISITTLYLYLQYDSNNTAQFDALYPVIVIYAFIDFFVTKAYDVKLHHLCILGIFLYNISYNILSNHRFILLYPLLKTELSSIFYVLTYWLPEKTVIYNINNLLFYLSFLKFRIYDFYYEIIYNNNSFNVVIENYSYSNYYMSSLLILSCYGLYILNIYWFLCINKILYKSINKIINIDTHILCHFLCSYIHFINIPLSLYIYSQSPHKKHILDITGITTLSVVSYIYHKDIYNKLYNREIEEYTILNKDNLVFFKYDNIAINFRSFLTILTNYYNSQYLSRVLLFSSVIHMISIYCCILNSRQLDKIKDKFLKYHNIMTCIPLACDAIALFINSPKEISIPFLLINITIASLFVVKPFNKLTHVIFHILLVPQNYYMCLSNK